MNRQARHRQKVMLKRALARLRLVLLDKRTDEVKPDKDTIILALQAHYWLLWFLETHGMDEEYVKEALRRRHKREDLEPLFRVIDAREAETAATYRRRRKRTAASRSQEERPVPAVLPRPKRVEP